MRSIGNFGLVGESADGAVARGSAPAVLSGSGGWWRVCTENLISNHPVRESANLAQ